MSWLWNTGKFSFQRTWKQRMVMGLWIVLLFSAAESSAGNRIQPWSENPRYWEYQGKPVLLLGGSDEDNLFNNPELMKKNFALYETIGGNYIRSTLSCRDQGNVWPFVKEEGQYNLEKFNPEFWERLESSLREAEKRDIIVQIEVWATFDYYRDTWLRNPFNPALNLTYSAQNTQLVSEWNFHPASKVQPFFFSIPSKNNDKALLKIQQAFVRKMLQISLPYPNVLYCLDNETRAPTEWAHYWGRFIHDEAKKQGTSVHLTEMWDIWDIRNEDHRRTYDYPELFSYTDISQNNWQVGQTHYDRLMEYRTMLAGRPGGIRPMNNVKVYGLVRPGKPLQPNLNLDRWWQNIFAGCASTRFHRPTGGMGLSSLAQKAIQAARVFTSEFDIFHCEPSPQLIKDRSENEAYCLADPGKIYALYFPQGGTVRLQVSKRPSPYKVRWFNIETRQFSPAQILNPQADVVLQNPFRNQMGLALVE